MNKNQLAAALADKTGSNQSQARAFLDALVETVQDTLAENEKVVVPGFGTWERKFSAARTAPNPATGTTIQVPARYRATFKAGVALKAAVNAEAPA